MCIASVSDSLRFAPGRGGSSSALASPFRTIPGRGAGCGGRVGLLAVYPNVWLGFGRRFVRVVWIAVAAENRYGDRYGNRYGHGDDARAAIVCGFCRFLFVVVLGRLDRYRNGMTAAAAGNGDARPSGAYRKGQGGFRQHNRRVGKNGRMVPTTALKIERMAIYAGNLFRGEFAARTIGGQSGASDALTDGTIGRRPFD